MADTISHPVLTERFDRALVYANALRRMDLRKLVDVAHQKKAPWFERKRAYLGHLRAIAPARLSSLLVSAADKLHNVRSIDADARRPVVGEAVYERFSGKRLGTLWYYRELGGILTATPGRHELMAEGAAELFAAYCDGRASLAAKGTPQT